ncbi:choice-of-anchor L domain-containing protein [Ichthyenterobacterium sp. W332]|uniref:Choice-of-anchor L domain-containing protein n=1 Tax=Microcosmobacter mediterraneus TaxID=3075607 RepID=A0ABU2YH21_9FLAO|nr:choice-of-anchor L domain-containing protein [Ichthyenterobacterium sp. W332]MDT0557070.1 choice-of-anchor L domain-containing protein [Ichthyenterobacterium sp. W332]
MKRFNRYLALLSCLFAFALQAQQITIDNTQSPQNLIENNLIQGCVEVSNISSAVNGSVNGFGSFGYFDRASSNFPFDNGIVLSTGNATSGGNGVNDAILNEGTSAWGADADLETALGLIGTQNATSIEFDVVSSANQIQFNYILASEEYFGNFPCEYSDGFAFLIREAGSSDPYTNIAVVPGTSIPVNTNTIHDEIVGFCDAENEQFFGGYNVGDTNYNGRTTVLTASASITPDVLYHIKLVIADERDTNYDSAVFIEGNSFSASVDLGNDISTCADEVTLDGDIGNPNASYSWFYNGTEVLGETQSNLLVTQSGTYQVVIDLPLAGTTCTIDDTVEVTLSSTQNAGPITDFELCDTNMDALETFDLSTKTNEILATVPAANYSVTYHLTSAQAQNNVNAITTPIQNSTSSQTIFIRIEDVDTGCLAFISFNIVVNPLPILTDPTPLEVCDDGLADGVTSIDLSEKDDEIVNGQPNLNVTYHTSQSDADSGANPISLPYTNTTQTELLFVNVTHTETGCVSTTTLEIRVLDNPVINTEDLYIDACDADHDGFATFNLNDRLNDILQGITGVTVTYHETFEDAETGENPIPNPENYANIDFEEQLIYVRVEDDITGCASIAPIEIHTNLLLTETNITDFDRCDADNDEIEVFNLEDIEIIIANQLPDIIIEFYLTEEDRNLGVNALDKAELFEPVSYPTTLFITISNTTCSENAQFEIDLNPVIQFPAIPDQTVCDADQDGLTTVDLSQYDGVSTQSTPGFGVSYFLTEQDAIDNINVLPTSYVNSTNPFTVFARIQSQNTNCSDVNSFQIEVLPAPISTEPSDIVICDDDQDGLFIVDLDSKINEIVSSTSDRVITFHETLNDANINVSSIANSNAYESDTQDVFVRIENTITGCHSTETLQIIVNTLPVFSQIDNYKVCEDNSNGFADFIFNTKDVEILNGQVGKQVLYFETQNDADNRANVIDKNTAYQNTSNPQTIFVRVENLTDQNCYGTSSFTIEVGSNPMYNPPADWFVCDDISNDGLDTFDLSLKISEITNGITEALDVTFYTTEDNAINKTNAIPLEFTNTVNPQTIFVNVDNGTICDGISSFELNVVQSPEVSPAQPLVLCDDNYDGIVQVDLTIVEVDILDVRQDDIVVTYFETEADLVSDSNAISDPENYSTITNPQTVFVKITNTISNCYILTPIDISINLPPLVNDFQVYDTCDNASSSFDLTEINDAIVDDNTDVLFSYYTNDADARASTNTLNTDYTYTTTNDQIFVRVEFSTTGCFYVYPFNLNINPLPLAIQPNDIIECDDDFDGILEVVLSQQDMQVLGGQNPTNFQVTYHSSQDDAETNFNTLEHNYFALDGDVIFVRVENLTTGCYSVTSFTITINPRPDVDIPDQVICLDNLPLLVSANTNIIGDSYIWSTGSGASEIEITEIGEYWVTVTSEFGCETTSLFSVIESEAATIEVTETVDFSDPNNITVTISGIGNYLYVLDNGLPQESPVFENVTLGYHTITIIDLNGCSEVTKDVVVVDAPKFFTPNDDSFNDTWHIAGVETLPGTTIFIYDRYGKQIAYLTSDSEGWDGTYNGALMPSNDYWFSANVVKDAIEFEVKGHFTLKR